MEGILNIDKPTGLSSHDVVARLRRICGQRRIGHTGTLDPLATGVLVICLGRATRLVEYVVGLPKRYVTTIQLGVTTDSYDADGSVVEKRPFSHLTRTDIDAALPSFMGEIAQVPPMYSAIKRDGQPLYKLARQGVTVEREARPVTISALIVLDWTPPFLTLEVGCSTGTYIRSLAHDLGEQLGCGGHVTALRRTAVGAFTSETAVSLNDLTPESVSTVLQPAENAVAHLPRLELAPEGMDHLQNGRLIPIQPSHPDADLVALFDRNGRFGGIIERHESQWKPKKIFLPSSQS